MYHRRTTCRCCGAADLQLFLPLGPQPLANSFLRGPEEFAAELRFPLDVQFCPRCSLVQIADVVAPEVLFRNYIYVTGTSDTMKAHNREYARDVTSLPQFPPGGLVVEAASNDGSLLLCFQECGARTVGVEPAHNIAEQARSRGVQTISEFFDARSAAEVRSTFGPAKAFVANNVFAHVDDPGAFLSAAASLLDEDGLVIIESPYIEDFAEHLEYDTVYHEHLSYFSALALQRLCEQNGLVIVRFDLTPVHGGSFRMYAGRKSRYREHCAGVLALIAKERQAGYHSLERWERFAANVLANRVALRQLLESLSGAGKTLAGYGAPAKGNTLLNYCGIGTEWLPYTVDKSPLKVGLYTPGMHLPVLPVSTLLERQPDYLLILPWNFAQEIMAQQSQWAERGGKFVLPIPTPRVMSV